MSSDNHVSTILLLILIGIAIYYLLNSKDNFNNQRNLEKFIDEKEIIPNTTQEEEVYEEVEVDEENVNSQENVNSRENVNSQENINDQDTFNQAHKFNNSLNAYSNPNHSNPNHSNPINHSNSSTNNNQKKINGDNNINPILTYDPTTFNQQRNVTFSMPDIISEKDNIKKPIIDASLFDFAPVDESINYIGVSLSDAFSPPLPPGTNSDLVDFKKGNMDNYDAKDFLPKEVNDKWFETDFSLAKYQLNDDKLINTDRYIIGINTVGQSLKNASYDIRGTIPNPKFVASPWNNSTYEPDFNLKPLC